MISGNKRRLAFAAIIAAGFLLPITSDVWAFEKIACPLPVLKAKDDDHLQAVTGGTTSVYFDASASMAGYLGDSGAASRSVFYDILSTLPDIAPEDTQFARFGTWIEPLHDFKAGRLATTPGFYGAALNQDSRIDLVFNKAAEASLDDLTIVVTDLFLSGKNVNVESSPLRKPLTKALDAGKAVAIVGIVGGYRGRIDGKDLPSGIPFPAPKSVGKSGKKVKPEFVGFRPFYLVLVGPESRIIGLLDRRDWKRMLADIPSELQAVMLYSHDMVGPVVIKEKPAVLEKIEAIRERDVLRDEQKVLQLIIDRDDFKVFNQDTGVLKLALKLEQAKTPTRPGYALDQTLKLSQTLYEFTGVDKACAHGRFIDGNRVDTGKAAEDNTQHWRTRSTDRIADLKEASGQTVHVSLLAGPLKRLPRDRVFLLDIDVVATRVRKEGGTLAWMQEWSFEAKDEEKMRRKVEAAASGKGFLPTLNLWPLNESLIEIVSENYPGEPVARARLVFRIE